VNERRPVGALEAAVLECLWGATEPLTPRQVLESVDPQLAYTTVVTILTRLADKGVVDRERHGKVYLYRPRVTEADLVAGRMAAALDSALDRRATLSRFVAGLSKREAKALRKVLDDMERGERR
jgi:predicted transcriptional regulator